MNKVFAAFFLCFVAMPSWAETSFPDALDDDQTRLIKSGETTFRFLNLFKAFDAVLYLEEGYSAEQFPGEFKFSLSLHYHRPFKRDQLINSANNILKDLHPDETLENLDQRINTINDVYQDVSKGDKYTLAYDPEKGTQLLLNGDPKTVIEGFDFAKAYFAIWLGEHPTTRKLGKALLRQEQAQAL